MIRHDFFQTWREAGFPTTIVDLTLAMIEDRLGRLAVAAVGGAELLATSDVAALRAAVDLAPFTVSADEEKSKAFLTAADCLAEDCGGGLWAQNASESRHPRPKVARFRYCVLCFGIGATKCGPGC